MGLVEDRRQVEGILHRSQEIRLKGVTF